MRELSLNNCRLDKRYEIFEQLGRGSYAEIYLARDILASPQSPHSTVVIKALNVFLQDDLDADLERTLVENFQNEAIALDRVRHPNIISRIGHGTARDLKGTVFHYLVLEYLSGGDLQTLLRKQKTPLATALNYIEQICAGLGHAHRYSIIHRDIKPQNLLLTKDLSTVKIADFGVARVHVSDSPITRVGTNIYAPPEHSPLSAGQTGTLAFAKLTPAADIYSLAKTIYTMLIGEAPRAFANSTITELPGSIRHEAWANELIRVLRRATSGDSRQRHQTVDELWADLAGMREIADSVRSPTVREGSYAAQTGTLPYGRATDTGVSAKPRPHVSRGYTPIAPDRPSFESLGIPLFGGQPPLTYTRPVYTDVPKEVTLPVIRPEYEPQSARQTIPVNNAKPKKKRRFLRRLTVFVMFIAMFTGALYGTASYIRSLNILPEFHNPFRIQTGIAVANTDIYLRPGPNSDNDPIGLVTKNSKVRIVNSQNNWYQVDIVEQGRVRATQPNATRGWLNGKYLDLNDN